MHQIVSLLFTLIEMKYFEKEYHLNTIRIGNLLGLELDKLWFNVVKRISLYTKTHHIFIECSEKQMYTIFYNSIKEHITLNIKKKVLFHGNFGIRLGLQEISIYNWDDDAIRMIARNIFLVSESSYSSTEVQCLMKALPSEIVHFTFDKNDYEGLILTLSNKKLESKYEAQEN
jgi:glycine/serine hydroxymethyltransferase